MQAGESIGDLVIGATKNIEQTAESNLDADLLTRLPDGRLSLVYGIGRD